MNNFESGAIYTGNIMKYQDGEDIVLEENALLSYDANKNTFVYIQSDAFNCQLALDLERDKLSSEEIKEYEEVVKKYTYPYEKNLNGDIYVDASSVKLADFGNNNRRGHRK